MPRYLLFGGDQYYPEGGWHDFRGGFDTVEEAWRGAARGWDWWHIVDTSSGEIVEDHLATKGKGATLSGPGKFIIMARMPGQPAEEVDEADDLKEAKYLVGEYRIAYGPQWTVWYKRG